MPRKPVFPLPDDVAKKIAIAAHQLTLAHPAAEGSRPFLAAFIEAVHSITGRLYGPHTYRKMLQLYARDFQLKPSTQTINDVFQAYKRQARADGQCASELVERSSQPVAHSALRPLRPAVDRPGRAERSDEAELARLQQMEISRLQSALQDAEARCRVAEGLRESLATQLSASQARAQALEIQTGQQRQSMSELFEKVERIQAQADASNKHALLQVERVRAETREAKEEGEQLRRRLAAREVELRNERALSVSLRQRLNATSAE